MARLARIVVPGIPHLVTQRGNRRQQVFFSDADYATYLNFLGEYCAAAGTKVLAGCLMPDHVHLILVPKDEQGLRKAVQETHRRYTQLINRRNGWTGFLWKGRFASCPLDEAHLLAATKYVELNPVRAGLVARSDIWSWSSVHAHLAGKSDGLVNVDPLLSARPDWPAFLAEGLGEEEAEALRRGERTGRPVGSAEFIKDLELKTGRRLAKQKPGRRPLK